MTIEKEIALLFPEGKKVTLKGKEYNIEPFGFGQFPKVLKLFKDIKDIRDGTDINIASLVMENAEVVVELSMLATGEQRSFFDKLPMDQGIELVRAIAEVNSDFFIKTLHPKLLEALEWFSKSVGVLSSQSSLPPATA